MLDSGKGENRNFDVGALWKKILRQERDLFILIGGMPDSFKIGSKN